MKTKEFIRRAKELGFVAGIHLDGNMAIFARDGVIVFIDEYMPYGLIMDTKHLKYLTEELFDLCVEYAKTPIEERKDEEKFYLQKIKRFYEPKKDNYSSFLNYNIEGNRYTLKSARQTSGCQTKFTQKEIDEIKERFNTDLEEFRQIEVDSDEV
jgi:hypothetical protein